MMMVMISARVGANSHLNFAAAAAMFIDFVFAMFTVV